MVEDFELYISEDTTNWGSPVVTGTFAENADEKHVNFISKRGRYIRFRALSEVDGDPWTSMAEMNVYADTVFSNLPPNGFINLPTNSLEIIVGDSVEFTGSGNDANGHYPLTYLWEFGTGSGITDSNLEDPGFVTFDIPGNFTVRFTVFDSQGLPDPIPDIRNIQVIQQQIIGKSSWSLVYVDSEELNSSGDIGPAVNGFDGDPNTIWHTEWIGSDPDLPHEIQIDLGAIYFLAGFNYLPRQDGPDTGTIKDYEFYVSMENTNWGTPVASGRFVENTQEKNVLFSPKHGRYIRLRALLEVDGDPYTSMAEIDIVAQDEPLPVQLSTFAGEYLGNKITLRWKTESEINNLGFIILRKKMEEELFREINNFHYLETLLGKGTTNQATAYTYIDKNIQIGETYLYLLENVDFYGNIEIHGPISVETRISSSLSGYRLYQNFPNPFNSATKIPYFLPSDNFTSIILYDLLGRKVQMLLSEKKKAGYHEFIFQPDHLRTGIYYYKIQMGDYQAVKQMLLVR
jgi:PKD repeat protein